MEIRELPGGARQSETKSELTLEQPAEDVILCRLGRNPTVEREGHESVCEGMVIHEIEWYRVVITSL